MLLNFSNILQLFNDLFKLLAPNFRIGDLPCFEPYLELHLFPFFQPLTRFAHLHITVKIGRSGGKPHRLYFNLFLLFTCFPLSFGLFVGKLAIIQNAAYRWSRIGSNFYQIKPSLLSYIQGLFNWDNALVFAVLVNQSDFTGTDSPVNAIIYTVVSCRSVTASSANIYAPLKFLVKQQIVWHNAR